MRKNISTILVGLLVILVVFAGNSIADENNGNDGPSDQSGDGNSDGSEFEPQNGPNGESDSGSGNGEPAPNSGDGDSDGPGW